MSILLEPPYTIKTIEDGITYEHVNDGITATLSINGVTQATTEIEGDIFLDDISQVSGLPASNITLFDIYKKL